jgi:hypothetical protein
VKYTKSLPKKEGYYWFKDGGEHTPTVLEVKKDGKKLWASNEEFCFAVSKPRKGDNPEYWCYIPEPS